MSNEKLEDTGTIDDIPALKWAGTNLICVKSGDTVIKTFNKERAYLNELKWIKILPDDITPILISSSDQKMEIVQTYCGLKARFIELPEDYKAQLDYIEKQMTDYNCNGSDCEIACDEKGKIKIIDLSAFGHGKFLGWQHYSGEVNSGTIKNKTENEDKDGRVVSA